MKKKIGRKTREGNLEKRKVKQRRIFLTSILASISFTSSTKYLFWPSVGFRFFFGHLGAIQTLCDTFLQSFDLLTPCVICDIFYLVIFRLLRFAL